MHVNLTNGGWLIVIAIIAAVIATRKNKNGLVWFILTMVFGPLAIVVLFLGSNTKK